MTSPRTKLMQSFNLQLSQLQLYFCEQVRNHYEQERDSFITNFSQIFTNKLNQPRQNLSNNITHLKLEPDSATNFEDEIESSDNAIYCNDDFFTAITSLRMHQLFNTFLPAIFHLKYSCPYSNIRASCSKLLQRLSVIFNLDQEMQPPYPISLFLDLETVLADEATADKSKDSLLQYLFTLFGRLTNFDLLLSTYGYFSYLKKYRDLMHTLMNETNCGALMCHERYYLAIMACSRYGSESLITQNEMEFLKIGGELTWIKTGISTAPYKYHKINELNARLAHQPWTIKASFIATLVRGDNCWTISELVQAITIMVCYHFLCAMYDGMCITPEYDHYYMKLIHQHSYFDGADDLDRLTTDLKQFVIPFSHSATWNSRAVTTSTVSENEVSDKQSDKPSDEDNEDSSEVNALQTVSELLNVPNNEKDDLLDKCTAVVGDIKTAFETADDNTINLEAVTTEKSIDKGVKPAHNLEFTLIRPTTPPSTMEFDPTMEPSPSPRPEQKQKQKQDSHSQSQTNANTNIKTETDTNTNTTPSDVITNHHLLTAKDWKQITWLRYSRSLHIRTEPKLERVQIVTIEDTTNTENEKPNIRDRVIKRTPKGRSPNSKKGKPKPKPKATKIKYKRKKLSHKISNIPKTQGLKYSKYSSAISMTYSDFDPHIRGNQIHSYDFSWSKQGYVCLSKYYSGVENKMDECFLMANSMTDRCINTKPNVDTLPFRSAIWHYAFRLYGINDDSYDYRNTNLYLPVKLKFFIKKLICYSQIVTIGDVRNIGISLKEKEKLHIAILALEAKKQACLLFALRAVTRYVQAQHY